MNTPTHSVPQIKAALGTTAMAGLTIAVHGPATAPHAIWGAIFAAGAVLIADASPRWRAPLTRLRNQLRDLI